MFFIYLFLYCSYFCVDLFMLCFMDVYFYFYVWFCVHISILFFMFYLFFNVFLNIEHVHVYFCFSLFFNVYCICLIYFMVHFYFSFHLTLYFAVASILAIFCSTLGLSYATRNWDTTYVVSSHCAQNGSLWFLCMNRLLDRSLHFVKIKAVLVLVVCNHSTLPALQVRQVLKLTFQFW